MAIHSPRGPQPPADQRRITAQPLPAPLQITRRPANAFIAQDNVDPVLALIVKLQLKGVGHAGIAAVKPDLLPCDADHIGHRVDIHPDRPAFRPLAIQPRIHIGVKRRDEGTRNPAKAALHPIHRRAKTDQAICADEKAAGGIRRHAKLKAVFKDRADIDLQARIIGPRQHDLPITRRAAQPGHGGAISADLRHSTIHTRPQLQGCPALGERGVKSDRHQSPQSSAFPFNFSERSPSRPKPVTAPAPAIADPAHQSWAQRSGRGRHRCNFSR